MRHTKRSRVNLLGVEIDALSLPEALTEIAQRVAAGGPSLIVTPNVDHLVKLQDDSAFAAAYRAADLVLADGAPVLWACRALGRPLPGKVSGSDLGPALAAQCAQLGHSLYLLGGRPGAADEAARRLQARHPGLRIAGTDCPPFRFERTPALNRATIERVRAAAADVLLVGLGAPRQELWLHRHLDELGAKVALGVGITIEFMAGRVQRAPRVLQRVGLEWSWRLAMEPRRLWRRYLLDDPVFFRLVARQWRQERQERRTRRRGAGGRA